MKRKSIVKTGWLPFVAPSEERRRAIENHLLTSRPGEEPPPELEAGLGPEERAYLREKAAQIQGQLARLLELSKSPETTTDGPLWEERLFLQGFALMRTERSSEANACFRRLPARFAARIAIERALHRLNRGDFSEAEAQFRDALETGSNLDPYSICTALGGLCLSLIQQGDFAEARRALERRRAVLQESPSPILASGTHLYEILLLLEQNEFEAALETLRRSFREQDRDSVNWFFLLHLQLRLRLARNDLEAAGETLTEVRSLARRLGLNEGVLDVRLEEIEWNLRSQQTERARQGIEELRAHAESRKDEYLAFRVSLLRAQALHQEGLASEALKEIAAAIAVGQAKQYLPALVWAFFHASGLAFAAGQIVPARLYLNRGRQLAARLRLRAREAAFSYMAEILENRFAAASALIALARHQEIGPELEYFLESYRLLEEVQVTVIPQSGGEKERIDEPRLRRLLLKSPGVFWFQKEAVLLVNDEGQVRVAELQKGSPILAAFRMFWNAHQNGLTIPDLHRSRSSLAYREDLHASAAKMVLSRLRSVLAPLGIAIDYNRAEGRYRLRMHPSAFTILSEGEKRAVLDRESEILERIAMEAFVSTRRLCEEFGVSRQALHPYLKKLVALGRIRCVRRGPVSGYIARR